MHEDDESILESLGKSDYIFSTELRTTKSGYVQLIDLLPLIKQLASSDLQLQLHFSPGNYVVKGSVFGLLYAKRPIKKDITANTKKHFILGAVRTPVQDPVFAIGQLVEIALRALSPSINDPYTAITCIDKLSSTLCSLAMREFPKSNFKDDNNELRLHCKALTFIDVANAAFDQIRIHARNNVTVTIRLLESLEQLALRANNKEQYQFIYEQIKMISEQQEHLNIAHLDNKAIVDKIYSVKLYLSANNKT